MPIDSVICKKCNAVDDYKTSESGPHIRADCNKCGGFIKFLPQSFIENVKFHFGKYVGQRIYDITDSNYLEWALRELKSMNNQTRRAIQNRLQQLQHPA